MMHRVLAIPPLVGVNRSAVPSLIAQAVSGTPQHAWTLAITTALLGFLDNALPAHPIDDVVLATAMRWQDTPAAHALAQHWIGDPAARSPWAAAHSDWIAATGDRQRCVRTPPKPTPVHQAYADACAAIIDAVAAWWSAAPAPVGVAGTPQTTPAHTCGPHQCTALCLRSNTTGRMSTKPLGHSAAGGFRNRARRRKQ